MIFERLYAKMARVHQGGVGFAHGHGRRREAVCKTKGVRTRTGGPR